VGAAWLNAEKKHWKQKKRPEIMRFRGVFCCTATAALRHVQIVRLLTSDSQWHWFGATQQAVCGTTYDFWLKSGQFTPWI
jgi:hypothetical protein